jgi:hypothetical protein
MSLNFVTLLTCQWSSITEVNFILDMCIFDNKVMFQVCRKLEKDEKSEFIGIKLNNWNICCVLC